MNTFNEIIIDNHNTNDFEYKVIELFFKNFDSLSKGDIIATIESSKAAIDIEATSDGYIQYGYKINEFVVPGDIFAVISNKSKIVYDFSRSNSKTKDKDEIPEYDKSNEQNIQISKKAKKLIEKNSIAIDIFKGMTHLRERDVQSYLDSFNLDSDSEDLIDDESKPSYRKNYINDFDNIKYGSNCFISLGASVQNLSIGDRVWINKYSTVFSGTEKPVEIGSDCYIGPYVWIEGHGGIEIGNYVHIAGPSTCLYTHSGMKIALNSGRLGNPDHNVEDDENNYFESPIKIGSNVWIGPNCTIFPGTTIEDNVVIMPNTLVKSGVYSKYCLVKSDGTVDNNSNFVKNLSNSKSSF